MPMRRAVAICTFPALRYAGNAASELTKVITKVSAIIVLMSTPSRRSPDMRNDIPEPPVRPVSIPVATPMVMSAALNQKSDIVIYPGCCILEIRRACHKGDMSELVCPIIRRLPNFYFLNLSTGGFRRLPFLNSIASAGHTSIQEPQEKQSAIILFLLRIDSMTVEGQAFAHFSHPIHFL